MLYHEKQVAALCGVHCLNTLLQGPYFSEVELAQIAHELDAMERAFMSEGGVHGDDYLKFVAEGSGNVDASGMFSIQVLSKALEVWNLQAVPINNPEVKAAAQRPEQEEAFICNLQEHWFTIRRLGSEWWNFNSLFPAPQPLSQFYLAAFLASLQEQGYNIFVVRGQLPPLQQHRASDAGANGAGQWFTPDQARVTNEDAQRARDRGKAVNAVENAFARAAAQGGTMTLRSKRAAPAMEQGDQGFDDDEDADLAAAIAASLEGAAHAQPTHAATAGGASGSGQARAGAAGGSWSQQQPAAAGPSDQHVFGGEDDMDVDPELAAAIAASLQDMQGATGGAAVAAAAPGTASAGGPAGGSEAPEAEALAPEPEAGAGVVELAFRLPGGARGGRRFAVTEPLSQLYAYLRVDHGLQPSKHVITTQFPRKELAADPSLTLADAGLTERQMLNVELKR